MPSYVLTSPQNKQLISPCLSAAPSFLNFLAPTKFTLLSQTISFWIAQPVELSNKFLFYKLPNFRNFVVEA
jgi:hypothetical protein